MCGIVLLHGPNASRRLPESLNRLLHRGPDDYNTYCQGNTALGFSRLAINGVKGEGHQPFQHEDFIGAFNGEVYNQSSLTNIHGLAPSTCATSVILPLLKRLGPRVIDLIDGFYSGVAYQITASEVFCLRDHMGEKPLFVGRSGSELFITSELKAFDSIDWFKLLPRGASRICLSTGQVTTLASHSMNHVEGKVTDIFERSVLKRMPRHDQPMGVFLSGGLDSSLIAAVVSKLRTDVTYFTLGNEKSSDLEAVRRIIKELGLNDVRVIPLPSYNQLPGLLESVVYATESYNPSIVSNGLATFLLAQAAHQAGIKVVLTGEGADELFGGYHYFGKDSPWKETREQLINDMQFTELRRLDMSCMAHSVEPRCPFLDVEMRSYSDQLDFDEMYSGNQNKIALRRAFVSVLPGEILNRSKTSCDVGSGIRGQVVRYLRRNGLTERRELQAIWQQIFPHRAEAPFFHSYPAFDEAIDRRGETHR